jgi:hypothetical protein
MNTQIFRFDYIMDYPFPSYQQVNLLISGVESAPVNVLQSVDNIKNITAGVVDRPPANREASVRARQVLRSARPKVELA